ncbi:MAG: L-threonylcarbamoyladenylate synthase [Candidatus Heteroscillospira sp.]|jgi:dephospho-CoA kinase
MDTRVFGLEDIPQAAELIRSGGLVAVPTETVYGLCCSGLDADAVREVYELKGRPEVKPLSLMLHDFDAAKRYCREIPPAAYALAEKFLPGPLTIILPARTELIPEVVRAGGDTIGIRCPDHSLTLELLRELDGPMAGPSANPSGAPSPKSAKEVLAYFDGKIPGVLEGGECALGVESTILDMSSTPYRVLRRGALGEDEIASVLRDSMTVIGITGGTGGGKTTALDAIRELGGCVIDCDAVYHGLLENSTQMLSELGNRFPGVIADGKLDRKALGRIVFADVTALMELNAITHKYVREETARRLGEWAMQGGRLAAIDAIALIESGMGKSCTDVVGVTAPREVRIERLMRREGISREYAQSRIDAQKPDSWFEENCDHILRNDGTVDEFRQKCLTLFTSLTGGDN